MSQWMQQGQPMIILGGDSQRTFGQDAQSMNITAEKAIAEAIRTTLGPEGTDKVLVDSNGQVVVTDNGVTILKEMDIDHPAANVTVEVSKTQEDEIGDGTTTAIIDAGELLDQAEDLLDSDAHTTTVAQGYRQTAEKAKEVLENNAIEVTKDDRETLAGIAATAMAGKGTESTKDLLSELVVDAMLAVKDDNGIDMNNVSIEKVVGDTIDNSELVRGVIVDKEHVNENMPCAVEDANIAILDNALEARETEIDVEVSVTDPDQLQQFLDQEEKQLKEMINQLVEVGTDIVFVGNGVGDMAQHYLTKRGILTVRCVKSFDLKRFAHTTGGRAVNSLDDVEADDLGFAGSVGQENVGGDGRIFVEDVGDIKPVTLILHGGTEHVVDELERAIRDSLGVTRTTLEDGRVLPDSDTPETELPLQLREFADSVSDHGQFAVGAFAEALDIIPRTLAENAGLDPIDSLVDLRSRHDGGEFTTGLDAYTGEVIDMEEGGVVGPLRVKAQAIESAIETAAMILRIGDIIAAGNLSGGQTGGDNDDGGASGSMGGGMDGMGGMGGMDGAI